MESHYTADSCAQYLDKFYILPHTYRASIITRFFGSLSIRVVDLYPTTC